ncbi:MULTISPECIES: hypothetical protein [unclassified Nocardiopsis]|uniref:hypothetical protein n=1 Tax=unclassified Nocardiopsis TaxID=2649073 RepID=UPI001915BD65|nr:MULTISPECIES: hypothetical protein [unclassified Nocardiopsis]
MRTRHEHHWATESDHTTSEGVVAYQRCACGQRRVTLARPLGLVRDDLARVGDEPG